MLSYQHSYHAGCLADVHKHAALALMLAKLVEKYKPISYIETHAGRGLYDLQSAEAAKTEEALHGIVPLLKSKKLAESHPYMQAIAATQTRHGKAAYPGSPMIAKHFLSRGRDSKDRLFLNELHPQEVAALAKNLPFANVTIAQKDGYKEALAISPPIVKRGLVLIDPSYEVKTEYATAADFVLKLHKRWPVATILLWYPILQQGLHIEMCQKLAEAGLPKFWQQEISFGRNAKTMAKGTGLVCINTPFGIEDELEDIRKLVR